MLSKIDELYKKIVSNEFYKRMSLSNIDILSKYKDSYADYIKVEATAKDAYNKTLKLASDPSDKNKRSKYYAYYNSAKHSNATQTSLNFIQPNVVKLALEAYKIIIDAQSHPSKGLPLPSTPENSPPKKEISAKNANKVLEAKEDIDKLIVEYYKALDKSKLSNKNYTNKVITNNPREIFKADSNSRKEYNKLTGIALSLLKKIDDLNTNISNINKINTIDNLSTKLILAKESYVKTATAVKVAEKERYPGKIMTGAESESDDRKKIVKKHYNAIYADKITQHSAVESAIKYYNAIILYVEGLKK
jgi:hypothetical protein